MDIDTVIENVANELLGIRDLRSGSVTLTRQAFKAAMREACNRVEQQAHDEGFAEAKRLANAPVK